MKYCINLSFFGIIIVLFLLIFLGGSAYPQMSFYVSPPLFEIDQIAGGVKNFSVEISNTGKDKIRVKINFSDLSLSDEGKVELINSIGTTPYSLASWLSTKHEEITSLEPGEIKKILFQIRVPRGEKGGRYGVVVFEALPFSISHDKVSLGIRSGTLVFLTIPRTEQINGIIDEITLSNDGKEFIVILRNNGNIHYETEGSLIIKSQDGKVLHRIRFPKDKPTLLLPQGKRKFIIPWDKKDPLQEGNYIFEARMIAWLGNRTLNLDRKEILVELKMKEN